MINKTVFQQTKYICYASFNRCVNQKRLYSYSQSETKQNIIVQKFGGTSLGTADKMQKVINIITKFNAESNIVAVVSALSSNIKSEGTTSRLLQAARCAVQQKEFDSYLTLIEDTHFDIVYGLLSTGSLRSAARNFISCELSEIRSFCNSLSVIRELSPRSNDKIIGCGERMAAGLISYILKDQGYDSIYINLCNIFDGLDTNNREYQNTMKEKIKSQCINTEEDRLNAIPIVTGFVGDVNGGIMNSIGRGYSDFTAALTAGALNAKSLQIWKESDGVFTGNPTKIANARLLTSVTPEEALELTYFGNEVLHPFTMKCAIDDNIAIHILNTFQPDGEGTIISPINNIKTRSGPYGIVAVCSKKGVNVINININDQYGSFISHVLNLFYQHNVRIDLLSTSIANVSVAVHESVSMQSIQCLIMDLEQYGTVNLITNKSIVSCIGSGMCKQIGIVAKILQCLAEQDINMEMISYPSSEIIVSVVINADQMDNAIMAIHDNYISE